MGFMEELRYESEQFQRVLDEMDRTHWKSLYGSRTYRFLERLRQRRAQRRRNRNVTGS